MNWHSLWSLTFHFGYISLFWFHLCSGTKHFQSSFSGTVYYTSPPSRKVTLSQSVNRARSPSYKQWKCRKQQKTKTCKGLVWVESVWDRWFQEWWDANGCVKCLHMANSHLSIKRESQETVKHDGSCWGEEGDVEWKQKLVKAGGGNEDRHKAVYLTGQIAGYYCDILRIPMSDTREVFSERQCSLH